MNLIPVTQEDRFGCGVACAACILKQTYKDTKKLFDEVRVEEYGCDCPDITAVLNKADLNYRWGKYTGASISEKSIIYLGKSDQFKVGHWLVKTKNGWMNPWVTGASVKDAQAEFQNELPESNIEWYIYPVGRESG